MLHWRNTLFYLASLFLALSVLWTVNFKTDLSAFVIAGDNTEEILLASEMQTGALSRRYLISLGSSRHDALANEFIQDFRLRLKAIQGVVDVWSPEQQNGGFPQSVQTLYSRYGGALYSLDAEKTLAAIFTRQGLEQRAEFLKKALLSPQGEVIKKIAVQDPLLLTLNGFHALGEQLQKTERKKSRYRSLILESEMAGFDAAQQNRIQTEIKKAFEQLNQSRQDRIQLEMTGVPVFAVATQNLIQGDMARIGIFSSIGQIGFYLLIFRSIGSLFKIFTLLLVSLLSALLATQLAFGYVHGMTAAIGSTLIGICIDYPIHALVHAQAEAPEKRSNVIAKLWPSMLLGGMTTMVGYIALGASGYPGFKQVAVYAVAGIATALLLTRFVLPGLIAETSRRQLKVPLVAAWARFCARFRPWLIVLLLLALGLSLQSIKSLHWLQDLQDLTPELDYLKENDKRIRSRMVSIEPGRFLLVTGSTAEAALQKTEAAYTVLEQLKKQGLLSDYFGVYPWLLSAQMQQQNLAVLRRYLTADNIELWQQALRQQSLSVKHLGHPDYPAIEPLTPAQVLATPVKKLIDSRFVASGQQTMIMIWLAGHQPEALQAAFHDRKLAHYFSQRDAFNQMTRNYTSRSQLACSLGLSLIFLILLVRYKSVPRTLQTLLPSLAASLLILGIWSVSGTAVSFLHLVGFLLVVAICDDYGIFYQENRAGNTALTYQSMAASMLTSALAFGCLGLAESASLRILAGVVTLGILLGFLFCPLLIGYDNDKTG